MDSTGIIICAVSSGILDICALVLIIVSYVEKRTGKKRWSRISADMELVEQDRIYALECDEILIGRHASADIRIPDMSISRYHAMLNVTDGRWTVTDLGSKSGIFINGEPVQHSRLREGDVLMLGNRRLVFRKRRSERE
ncbi:MAG: FHA domain-containing protein [Ruminococcus flavefaciens]|nr:FHA domain-containing protein [Ruminococcus flavefaciens]MCM1229328.1 FHA domain-containing protein [Ruminococcus flavefaciens]